jgi:selenocysteine-specific elongation factor
VNLVGIERDELRRGDVLATPDSLIPTELIDARLELLPGKLRPLRSGTWVELHIGTAEVGVRVVPLGSDSIAAGTSALAQLKLEEQVACAAGDRFILRGSTGEQTIGGGVVLDAHPLVHKRSRDKAAAELAEINVGQATLLPAAESVPTGAVTPSMATLLRHEVAKSAYGLARGDALRLLNIGEAALDTAIAELAGDGLEIHTEGRSTHLTLPENLARTLAQIEKSLAAHHAAHPLRRRGLTGAEIAQAVSHAVRIPAGALQSALSGGVQSGRLKQVDDTFALASHAPKINVREEQAAHTIAIALEAGLAPEQPEELAPSLGLTKERLRHVVDYLREEGLALIAPGGIFFAPARVADARTRVREHLANQAGITVSEFNTLLGTTRKYGIPLLQLFEAEGMLVRDGDVRRLK